MTQPNLPTPIDLSRFDLSKKFSEKDIRNAQDDVVEPRMETDEELKKQAQEPRNPEIDKMVEEFRQRDRNSSNKYAKPDTHEDDNEDSVSEPNLDDDYDDIEKVTEAEKERECHVKLQKFVDDPMNSGDFDEIAKKLTEEIEIQKTDFKGKVPKALGLMHNLLEAVVENQLLVNQRPITTGEAAANTVNPLLAGTGLVVENPYKIDDNKNRAICKDIVGAFERLQDVTADREKITSEALEKVSEKSVPLGKIGREFLESQVAIERSREEENARKAKYAQGASSPTSIAAPKKDASDKNKDEKSADARDFSQGITALKIFGGIIVFAVSAFFIGPGAIATTGAYMYGVGKFGKSKDSAMDDDDDVPAAVKTPAKTAEVDQKQQQQQKQLIQSNETEAQDVKAATSTKTEAKQKDKDVDMGISEDDVEIEMDNDDNRSVDSAREEAAPVIEALRGTVKASLNPNGARAPHTASLETASERGSI